MKKQFKSLFYRSALYIIVFVLFISTSGYSRIIANRGHVFFDETAVGSGAIQSYIETGAGYFLSSGSDFLALLSKVELADNSDGSGCNIDCKDWAQTCANAMANMEKASANYLKLKQILTDSPYIPNMIVRLSTFDYDGYLNKNGLNRGVFEEVRAYCAAGNVRGIFDRMGTAAANILAELTKIKAAIDAGIMPGLPTLWRLNQEYNETILFGQYAAEIFYEITWND
jgi:hypothetical protein